eukprot:13018136-Alexandrium_andersonii.AAC.1
MAGGLCRAFRHSARPALGAKMRAEWTWGPEMDLANGPPALSTVYRLAHLARALRELSQVGLGPGSA